MNDNVMPNDETMPNNSVAHNVRTVQERIRAACQRSGRDPKQVRLLAVSKTQPASVVQAAVAAGQCLFGENRVMEAREKIPQIRSNKTQWHLIGPLQRNKVKIAVNLFQMIHSIDTLPLAQALSDRVRPPAPLPVLIQVNIGKESQKQGVSKEDAESLARSLSKLPGITLQGLMAIPPQTEHGEGARPYFQTLAKLARHIESQDIPGITMKELSMGMSHDFEIAVEEGATLVRVGSTLFGTRAIR